MKNKRFFILLISIYSLFSAEAQNKDVVITANKISEDVYMLTGQGGNIGIYVGVSSVFMIDDQYARLSEKIKKKINELTEKPIGVLFNTHMHGDHTGGNGNFNSPGTILVAHDNVRKSLQSRLDQNTNLDQTILPEVTFSKDITFHDEEETIMAFHVHNAHTNGDVMVYFLKNNVLHMGDTYFAGSYPYIDIKSGGSIEGYIKAHKKALLVINAETKIIPGHGRPSNKKELETYVAMLEAIKQKIQKAIDANSSMKEVIQDSKLTADYDKTYGNGFINPEKIRETIYKSLTGE